MPMYQILPEQVEYDVVSVESLIDQIKSLNLRIHNAPKKAAMTYRRERDVLYSSIRVLIPYRYMLCTKANEINYNECV
jgi:hypothetical protein